MALGKSIKIYLKDGTVTGIRFGEVVNVTILSIACPRKRLNELDTISFSKKPGVYFLFGIDDKDQPNVYIGESENVFERLKSHDIKKDFWNEVILFVSKDENLTKSHVKYLESKSIQRTIKIGRHKVENTVQPLLPSLPIADCDAMDEFLDYAKLLLGVFGQKLLEEVTAIQPSVNSVNQEVTTRSGIEIFLKSKINAKALLTDEGVVVLPNSEASKEPQSSLSESLKALRIELVRQGVLIDDGNRYIFTKEYLFKSPSTAASIVFGSSANGRHYWQDANGLSLKKMEELGLSN